jgi:Xaa-Pro aminopeptidase
MIDHARHRQGVRAFGTATLIVATAAAACSTIHARAQDVKPADPTTTAKATELLGLAPGEFRARRAALMDRVKKEAENNGASMFGGSRRTPLIVMRGSDESEIEARYRQSNDFAYLTGLEAPGAYLVLKPATGEETLYLPPVSPMAGRFSEARPGPGAETAAMLGIARVEPTSRVLADLFGAIEDPLGGSFSRGKAVLFMRTAREGAEGPEAKLERLLRMGAPGTEVRDLKPMLAAMRKAKSPGELAHLRKAVAITGTALDEAMKRLRPGVPEYELEGAIVGAFVSGDAPRAGFPSIVGSGMNATVPHYFSNSGRAQDGDLVVLDIGAEYRYYTADITRTYPVSGKFTPRQRAIYQLVLDAQKAVEKEMKPGVTKLGDMTRFTAAFFRKSPLRAKDEKGQERTMDAFFVHGLGHYLGMDVHDVGGMSEPVQVGEVFTIEPGLYIKSESIGVRIEDDYVMTENGPEKLSAAIVSDPDEVERAIAAARGGSTTTTTGGEGTR